MNERDFLLMLVDKELEEEHATCDDKGWIRNLIKAKKWLLERKQAKGTDQLIRSMLIEEDIKKYLKGEE